MTAKTSSWQGARPRTLASEFWVLVPVLLLLRYRWPEGGLNKLLGSRLDGRATAIRRRTPTKGPARLPEERQTLSPPNQTTFRRKPNLAEEIVDVRHVVMAKRCDESARRPYRATATPAPRKPKPRFASAEAKPPRRSFGHRGSNLASTLPADLIAQSLTATDKTRFFQDGISQNQRHHLINLARRGQSRN